MIFKKVISLVESLRTTNFTNISLSIEEEIQQHRPHVFICLSSVLVIFLAIKMFSRKYAKSEKRKIGLGKRPIEDLHLLNDIIEEIHYAACNCGRDPTLISRCRELLVSFPELCNTTLRAHNYTPFLRACWNGCTELITFMISIGADTDAVTDAGEGAIYLATYSIVKRCDDDFSALSVLLNAGLDINQARYDGHTALHLAAARGKNALVKYLIAHGAEYDPWSDANSPAQLAELYGHTSTGQLLKVLE